MHVFLKKFAGFALPVGLAVLLFAVGSPSFAQTGIVNGCPNSPENPTALLAVVGSAGAGAAMLGQRLRQRRKRK